MEAENAKAERTRLAAMAIAADVRERLIKRSSSITGMKDMKVADTKPALPTTPGTPSTSKAAAESPSLAIAAASDELNRIEQLAAVDRKAQMKSDIVR